MFNLKKIILIIVFILAASGMGFGLYYLFFKPALIQPPTEPNIPSEEPGVLPPVSEGTGFPPAPATPKEQVKRPTLPIVSEIASGGETMVKSVVKEIVQTPILNEATGDILYYNKDKSEFYKIDANGRKELLSDKKFYQVEKINWSPNEDKAILEYPDGNKILYDFNTKVQVSLDKSWSDFSFSANGEEIGLKIDNSNPDNRWLSKANADGTGLKLIEQLGENGDKVQVAWSPNGQVAAFSATGEAMGFDRQEILFIGFNDENFKSIIVEGRGFKGQWSPQGDRIIYSVWNAESGFRPNLWAVGAEGDNIGAGRESLDLQTWADKCAFSADNQNIYCAVPRELPEGSGILPEIVNSPDDFYKVDLVNGVKTFLAKPSVGEYSADRVFLSPQEDILYFTDKNTGQIYKIQLK